VLEDTHKKANSNCYCDYSFHILLGNPSEKVLAEFPVLREKGISSIKIYMTYAALQLSDDQILDVLLESRRQGITTMVHAENGQVIDWMTKKLEEKKLFDPKYHASSHPPMAEVEATYRAICLSMSRARRRHSTFEKHRAAEYRYMRRHALSTCS
jgi:dihydropyrimidinase